VLSEEFIDDGSGSVTGLRLKSVQWTQENGRWSMKPIEGSERVIPADCVLLALGFVGPERPILGDVAIELDARDNFKATEKSFMTSEKGLFAAGDCRRGQSLVVWAIAEGRAAAASIHRYLTPSASLDF
jgi:NADPH-dependent glutamate synthase beta subunit-like oxidoreductase